MPAGPTLIIQIPCFNEAATLGITLAALPRACRVSRASTGW